MIKETRLGIAEGAVIRGEGQLVTAGLGSCVGLVLYDTTLAVAGMVHIMLPKSPVPDPPHPQKYADTGINWLYRQLLQCGADATRLVAKYAGGAQMFRNLQTEALRIGDRNLEATADWLHQLHIPVLATEVGGHLGRTISFELPSRKFSIRTARGSEREI